MYLKTLATICVAIFWTQGFASAQTNPPTDLETLRSQSPWVFLGDSNTYSGGYVAILDAWLRGSGADDRPATKLLNLGMSSETASGLSEVDHPFKRPCVHERLSKILSMLQPKVVFICYGMNDGIYQPPNDTNQAAFEAGMLKLAKEIKASGATLICLTPPIFQPEPLAAKNRLGPTPEGRFAYFAPAENYNDTLAKQAQWCMENEMQADLVIDIFHLLAEEKQRQVEENPAFRFSEDGVHFGDVAHGLIAEKIIQSLRASASVLSTYPDNERLVASRQRMVLLRDAYISATGKNRPGLPAGFPVWYAEQMVK